MVESSTDEGRRRRPVRASTLALALGGVVLVCGVAFLVAPSDRFFATGKVYTAAVDLPPYHRIEPQDLREVRDRASSVDSPIYERDYLLGRYTLRPIEQDAEFAKNDVGPRMDASLMDRPLVSIPSNSDTAVAGILRRGDIVDMYVPGPAQSPIVFRGVVVMDIIPSSTAIVLAVPREQLDAFGSAADISKTRVVRVTGYAGS